MKLTREAFAARIEFSLVRPDVTAADIGAFCDVVRTHHFGTACVNPVHVTTAAAALEGTGIDISASIGFPFGSHVPQVKALETRLSLEAGATQIDMVINIGALRAGDRAAVEEDIRAVVAVAGSAPVKVILETGYLTEEEKIMACQAARAAGAAFVKTATGTETKYLRDLNPEGVGATVEDIRLMRRTVGPEMGVKAAGRIHTLEFALELLTAGADRLGTSQGPRLVEEFGQRFGTAVDLDVHEGR